MFLDRSSGRRRVSVVVLAAALVAAAATGPAASAGVAVGSEDPTGGPWAGGIAAAAVSVSEPAGAAAAVDSAAVLRGQIDGPASVYSDVANTNAHSRNIRTLKAAGVLDGTECSPNKFCPGEPLTRRTFAVWMVRVIEGGNAPDFVDPDVGGQSRFADVGADEPEALFIDRMAELGVTAGCATNPWRYCPDRNVSRGQMASFLSRAFDLPPAGDAGFTDVKEGNVHRDNIDRLSASGITAGCASKPRRYCPDNATTRGQMASFLGRAMVWQRKQQRLEAEQQQGEDTGPGNGSTSTIANPRDPVIVTGSDNSLDLHVGYNESTYQASVNWRPTAINPEQVSHYILQWRTPWEGYEANPHRPIDEASITGGQQIIDVSDQSSGRFSATISSAFYVYGIRVIVARPDGGRLASSEVQMPSRNNRLRDMIEEKVIKPYQDQQPWLKDTWDYIDNNKFGIGIANGVGAGAVYLGADYDDGELVRGLATAMVFPPGILDYFDNYFDTVVHELGHVYTLTGGLPQEPGPVGIGFLYLYLLQLDYADAAQNPIKCAASELYADMAGVIFAGLDREFTPAMGISQTRYWDGCRFQFDQQTRESVSRDAADIARAAFLEQRMPDWFYATYQKSNGKIDLDKLWADLNRGVTSDGIIYQLKDEFGGYCSEAQVRKFLDGDIAELDTPWRDAGC